MNKFSKKINFYSSIGMRASFGMIMLEFVQKDKNIIVLTSDVSTSAGLDRFRKQYKENYLEIGISEQNMIGVAAGLSNEGFRVFTSTFSPFQTLRCLEQIKVNLGYMNIKICMVGLASGLVLGNLGYTHCSVEDVGALRSIPNIDILTPCDGLELEKCLTAFNKSNNSMYIRLTGGAPLKKIYNKNFKFKIGEPERIRKGKKIILFSSGAILDEVLNASEILKKNKIFPTIINIHSLKPINKKSVLNFLKGHRFVMTIEEHNILGGLGSIISEIIAESGKGYKLVRLGVKDTYSKSGSYDYLKKIHEIDSVSIAKKVKSFLK
jgi:transketolase